MEGFQESASPSILLPLWRTGGNPRNIPVGKGVTCIPKWGIPTAINPEVILARVHIPEKTVFGGAAVLTARVHRHVSGQAGSLRCAQNQCEDGANFDVVSPRP